MAVLLMYTIFFRPADFPDAEFLVREVEIEASGPVPGRIVGSASTLEQARLLLPVGADYNLGRQPGDPAVIVETWV